MLDNEVMRLRVQHLAGNPAETFHAAQSTNKPGSMILDLRSADGEKAAVPAAAGFFAEKNIPLIILVNSQTCDGAALLAAQLRTNRRAIVIGTTNDAGKIRPDLTVAVNPASEKIFLGNPYFTPAAVTGRVSTNDLLPFVDHMSEAELVRRKIKDGEGDDESETLPRPAPVPVIRDPALARAVDLLKALAILHQARG